MVSRAGPLLGMALAMTTVPAMAETCADRLKPPRARSVPTPEHRALTAGDLLGLRDFGTYGDYPGGDKVLSLSPDGRTIAVRMWRADPVTNSYCFGIAVIPVAGGPFRLIDVGGEPILWKLDARGLADQDSGVILGDAPIWSPDGQWVAYLRRDHGINQLWRARADGTGSAQVTAEATDVRRFAWSADGPSIVYEVRPSLVAAVGAIDKEGRSGFVWDTRIWAFAGDRPQPSADVPTEFRIIAPGTHSVRAATPGEMRLFDPVSDPDLPEGASLPARGQSDALAWVGRVHPDHFTGPRWIGARIGKRQFRCDVAPCDNRILGLWWTGPDTLSFLRDWGPEGGGAIELFRWKPGGKPVSVGRYDGTLMGCELAGGALICSQERARQPRQLVRISIEGGNPVVIADPNPEWRDIRLGTVTRIPVAASDGERTFADLVLPPDHRPGERHPLIVIQYQSRGFLRGGTGDEYPVFLLAERGFAVLSYQRPRDFAWGSDATSLAEYARIDNRDWADRRRVLSSMEAAIDVAIAMGVVDPGAIGITGLSDGLPTVQYALLNSNRFRAAVVSSCCDDPYGSLYAGGPIFAEELKAQGYPAPGEDRPDFWANYSLALNAGRVAAPLLINAPDREYRGALQTVANLREAGKPVEMRIFPDEYHIKWQPVHRAAIYDNVLDWFDFWLRGREDPTAAKADEYRRWRSLRERSAPPPDAPGPKPGLDRNQPH